LNVSKSASQEEVKSSFLHLSKIHHPDAGGSTEQFQLLQDAFEHLKKDFKKRKIEKEEYDEYTPMVFTKFGPTENDSCIVGDCSDYQQRKSDIYQALAIQHELHPLYSSELHGFIEFLKLKPELLHGYLDFFSPYLSKIYKTENGILFELEDFLEEQTIYLKLREGGVYDYEVTEGQSNNLYLEIDDPDSQYDSIYIPKDIPISDTALGSHSLLDEIIVSLD